MFTSRILPRAILGLCMVLLVLLAFGPGDVALGSGPFLSIGAGTVHNCAVTVGHVVKCWGDNYGGQLGNGNNTNSNVPVDVLLSVGGQPLSGVQSIGGGRLHTCALMTAGTVK